MKIPGVLRRVGVLRQAKVVRQVWLAGLLVFSGLFAAPLAFAQSGVVVEQPLTQYINGALGTPVRVNGKPELEFIVDSGATLSGIWNSVIQQNSLRYRHYANADIEAADGNVQLRLLQFESLRVSSLNLEPPILMEIPDYYAYFRRPLSGILGADFLKNYVVVFDFPRHKIVFYPKAANLTRSLPGYFDVVPVTYEKGFSALLMSVKINGKKTRALLDTGAAMTTLLETEASRMRIDYKSAPTTTMTGINGKQLKAYIVDVDEVSSGGRTWDAPRIAVSQFTVDEAGGFTMLFGIDLLGQTPFAIDYGRNRLLLAKPEAVRVAEAERTKTLAAQGLLPGGDTAKGFDCAFPAKALEGLTCETR